MAERPLWIRTVKVAHELTLSKVCPVFVGMILRAAIAITVAVAFLRYEPDLDVSADIYDKEHRPLQEALVALTIFIVLVFSAVGLKLAILSWKKRQGCESHESEVRIKTYTGGLAMMPGWGWKDFIVVLTLHVLGKEPHVWAVTLTLLALAFGSACLQIVLEHLSQHVEKDGFLGASIVTCGASFAVGVGYALNLLFKTVFVEHLDLWSYWLARLCYVLLITAFVIWAQDTATAFEEKHKAEWHPLAVKTLQFFITSGKFLLGWAWKGFFDLVLTPQFHGMTSSACGDQILESFAMTFLAVFVVGLDLGNGCAQDVCMLIAGICVGWTWAQSWLKCYYVDKSDLPLMWISALIAIAAAAFVAVLLDFAFEKAQDWIKEHDDELEPLALERAATKVLEKASTSSKLA